MRISRQSGSSASRGGATSRRRPVPRPPARPPSAAPRPPRAAFPFGTEQLRAEHIRIGRIDHDAFHRLVQQRLGMVHQVGVQRVVACYEHHQRALPAPAGPVACCQNDATVPGNPASSTASRPAMSIPSSSAFVVASPRNSPLAAPAPARGGPRRDNRRDRRPPCRQLRSDVLEPRPRTECGELRSSPRPHERQRPGALGHQVRHHPGRLRSAERRTGAPSRREGQCVAPAPTARPCARRAASRPRSPRATVCPINSAAVSPGAAVVALAKITVGPDRRRRVTLAEPKQAAQHHRPFEPQIPR